MFIIAFPHWEVKFKSLMKLPQLSEFLIFQHLDSPRKNRTFYTKIRIYSQEWIWFFVYDFHKKEALYTFDRVSKFHPRNLVHYWGLT